jgi:hypothetical protein
MTNDALSVVVVVFSTVFQLFNSWYIPGTNVTPAVALFGILFISILFRILARVFGLWDDGKGDSD